MFEIIYEIGFWFFIVVLSIANFLFCTYEYSEAKQHDKIDWVVGFLLFFIPILVFAMIWHIAIPALIVLAAFIGLWKLFTDKIHPTVKKLIKEKV